MKHVAATQRSLIKHRASQEGTRRDYLYSSLINNKVYLTMADLLASTMKDANGKEHVYSRTQPKSVTDQILHDNVLYIHRPQALSQNFVNMFV